MRVWAAGWMHACTHLQVVARESRVASGRKAASSVGRCRRALTAVVGGALGGVGRVEGAMAASDAVSLPCWWRCVCACIWGMGDLGLEGRLNRRRVCRVSIKGMPQTPQTNALMTIPNQRDSFRLSGRPPGAAGGRWSSGLRGARARNTQRFRRLAFDGKSPCFAFGRRGRGSPAWFGRGALIKSIIPGSHGFTPKTARPLSNPTNNQNTEHAPKHGAHVSLVWDRPMLAPIFRVRSAPPSSCLAMIWAWPKFWPPRACRDAAQHTDTFFPIPDPPPPNHAATAGRQGSQSSRKHRPGVGHTRPTEQQQQQEQERTCNVMAPTSTEAAGRAGAGPRASLTMEELKKPMAYR